MAKDEKNKDEAAAKPADDGQGKGGLPIKTLIIVVGVMLLEAGIFGGVYMMAGGPPKVKASELAQDEEADKLAPVEIPLLTEKFQNTRRGIPYTYDTEIIITVQKRYAGSATADEAPAEGEANDGPWGVAYDVERMQGAIRTDIARIFRSAEPATLAEDDLATIRRQIREVLRERLGEDEEGNPYVLEVLIPKCTQFRSDM